MSTITRVTRRDMHLAVRDRVDFKYNESAHGTWTSAMPRSGWMDHDTREDMRRHCAASVGPIFVVYSYATPIGVWTESDGWWINPEKYSRTTGRHQGMLRRGIDGAW